MRFYLQEKEDPHDHGVFVGNLPVSLAQRQYERILLKLLGAKGKNLVKMCKKWGIFDRKGIKFCKNCKKIKNLQKKFFKNPKNLKNYTKSSKLHFPT